VEKNKGTNGRRESGRGGVESLGRYEERESDKERGGGKAGREE
jgi:hypothetical protein